MWKWLRNLFVNPVTRATLLRVIAQDAAALAVALNPNAPWTQLLDNVVQQIVTASGTPTTNQAAIQRAAAQALAAMGRIPAGNGAPIK